MPRALGLTRVTIVEDHHLFAEVLDAALTLQGHQVRRIPIVPGFTRGQVLARTLRSRPRIVLLDLDLGGGLEGKHLVAPLVRASVQVVVLTGSLDEARWGDCLQHGARTVLPKTAPLNTVLRTIRLIEEGKPVLDRAERDRLIAAFHRQRNSEDAALSRFERLSRRECEILGQLMAGKPVAEIARRSYVTEATVRTQVKSILAKLEVSSQLMAVGLAHRAGWQPPEVVAATGS